MLDDRMSNMVRWTCKFVLRLNIKLILLISHNVIHERSLGIFEMEEGILYFVVLLQNLKYMQNKEGVRDHIKKITIKSSGQYNVQIWRYFLKKRVNTSCEEDGEMIYCIAIKSNSLNQIATKEGEI